MLIVFSGLPGSGKTTVARALAAQLGAAYLRIDSIEQALRNAQVLVGDVGRSGYDVANALALGNLQLGNRVVVDGVNPVAESREAWSAVAMAAGVMLLNVELVCSDRAEHQRRVQGRVSDVPGLKPPTWASVVAHDYQAWAEQPLCIDTAALSADEAVQLICRQLFPG
ncbi:AAA family ATPase [Pseudomonas sp. nanlin1]|uniref:AAA family ATPase n=1 Tax=Pseudomonas sp. nanlin1 TaxID=3040605 RepID=UPI00388DAF89